MIYINFAMTLSKVSRNSLSSLVVFICAALLAINLPRSYALNLNLNLNRSGISRRHALASVSTFSFASTFLPQNSNAAPPMTVREAESPASQFERKRRKAPSKLLRSTLTFDFAVLLMRSSYNAMDALDCVPMDQFQKDFFFIRQAEWLPYLSSLGPGLVKQGDLSDPYYFDFISFAQYATIYRDVTLDPPMVFEESQPVIVGEDNQEFITKVIRRDPAVLSNSMLPGRHEELVGSKILDELNDLFGETTSSIPPLDSQSSAKNAVASLQQMMNLFLIQGFAFDGKVELKKEGANGKLSGSQIEMTLTAPATLWSGAALQLKKANTTNDFLLKTAKTFLKRAGYDISSSSLKYTSSQEISTLTVR